MLMKLSMKTLSALAVATFALPAMADELPVVSQTFEYPDNEPAPCHPLPTPRQIIWQECEFYAFFHYGMNTYTNLEWGMGSESVNTFAPTAAPNPRQWLEACKAQA